MKRMKNAEEEDDDDDIYIKRERERAKLFRSLDKYEFLMIGFQMRPVEPFEVIDLYVQKSALFFVLRSKPSY